MKSIWGISDCLTEVVGDFDRPNWLRTEDSVKAFANFKRLFRGDIKAGVIWFGRRYGKGLELIPNDSDYKPNDVIVGKTREYELAIAKVGKCFHPIIRTEIGYSLVSFIDIYAIWRPVK